MDRRFLVGALVSAVSIAAACEGGSGSSVTVRMDFARTATDFYSAPFPSEDLRLVNGRIDVDLIPGDRSTLIVGPALEFGRGRMRGFGTSSPIHLPMTGETSGALPTLAESIEPGGTVQLYDVSVTPAVPRPVRVGFFSDGVSFVHPAIALLPLQGRPLEPSHRHVAFVRRSLGDANGRPLGVAPSLRTLRRGGTPAGLGDDAADTYREALASLEASGVDLDELAGVTVFETQDPIAELREFYADALARPRPTLDTPLVLEETHPDYCVFRSTIAMPSYQRGETPFTTSGGGFVRSGAYQVPTVQAELQANVVISLPRRAMPAGGFPTVIHVRAGGTGEKPMVDRGPHPAANDPGTPGTGPAMIYARAGFAGITIDGPVGGLRNPSGLDEQFLVFNVNNPEALLDNLRQSALEVALTAHLLDGMTIAAATAGCADASVPGGETDFRFDTSKLAVFGHSMGASIAPLAVAIEPRLRAMVVSGAGASWIENVLHKVSPVHVEPLVRFALGRVTLDEFDPDVGMLQWIGEAADAQVYAQHLVERPLPGSTARSVLMFQGLTDHYILPPIANVLTLSLGLDVAGSAVDATLPELDGFESIATLLPWSGRAIAAYPVAANLGGGTSTGAVAQHLEDGVEDGHEVFFQLEGPRHQAQCFLESFAAGAPVIVAPAPLATACP